MPSTPLPAPKRLTKDVASRVLDRAAMIDAAEDKVDVATLRAAALDAGISPEAFERALSEAAPSVRDTPASGPRRTAYDVASGAFWVGLMSGSATLLLAFAVLGTDRNAAAGALVGGGGALIGVFVHLLRQFRNRS